MSAQIFGMLFGVSSRDVPTLLLTALVLISVAAIAALVPALRAASLDPMEALRLE